ncbi:olfactory receptor 6Y1-like [Xenopus laevis]|uniref:Olfactory receptor n=2 Tax=Xenopus laevis TaxID=8355 RepID=A0A1L8HPS3_XENLA|nr:olfactory receptor 6Y1-like [Xenopus laevis]OCT98092.1 hypothetical protein XELAEV_18010320mg [Xenopus laevis]
MRNKTERTGFLLLGFETSEQLRFLLFIIFLSFYVLTITTNMFIIGIIRIDLNLQKKPMYIFLSHFSFLEICYTTVTLPKMLVDFIEDNNTLSYHGCLTQIYFFFALGLTELSFLTVMSYDRYFAVCHPLRYYAIMTNKLCSKMAICSWSCGFLFSFFLIIPSSRFLFCGPTNINHFFCDFIPLLHISCNKTLITDRIFYTLAWIIILYSFAVTLSSYVYIIKTICSVLSRAGRRNAFSTCASHLTVVLTFYVTIIFMYIRPSAQYSFNVDKVISLFYAVVVPLLNPLVYTLRNAEVQEAFRKVLVKTITFI